MKVALLVDNGYAARQSLIPLRAGLSTFLDALPPEHEVGLFTTGDQVRLRVDFTTDRDELKDRATSLFADPGTAVFLDDGLVETWERWFDDGDAWPVFVTLVYGGSSRSRVQMGLLEEFKEFVVELRRRAATVHAVLVSTPSVPFADAATGPVSADSNVRPLGARRGGVMLSTFLTRQTGGTYRALAAATALPKAFEELGTNDGRASSRGVGPVSRGVRVRAGQCVRPHPCGRDAPQRAGATVSRSPPPVIDVTRGVRTG